MGRLFANPEFYQISQITEECSSTEVCEFTIAESSTSEVAKPCHFGYRSRHQVSLYIFYDLLLCFFRMINLKRFRQQSVVKQT